MDAWQPVASVDYSYIILPDFKQECWTNISYCIVASNSALNGNEKIDMQISNDGESLILTSYYDGLYILDIKTLVIKQVIASIF
jgi:hypothetical protein